MTLLLGPLIYSIFIPLIGSSSTLVPILPTWLLCTQPFAARFPCSALRLGLNYDSDHCTGLHLEKRTHDKSAAVEGMVSWVGESLRRRIFGRCEVDGGPASCPQQLWRRSIGRSTHPLHLPSVAANPRLPIHDRCKMYVP